MWIGQSTQKRILDLEQGFRLRYAGSFMPEPIALVFALLLLYWLVVAEGAFTLAMLRVAIRRPRLGRHWLASAEGALGRLAQRRTAAIFAVAMIALGGRALLIPILPKHQPIITDEFSYLLASNTFASGRLTNPAHPMWKHFESIHILQQPSYAAMYQPAQGLILAGGEKLTGNPWVGVYLSAGVMCAAVCWMLYGWLPPRWALFAGILFALRIGLLSYWMNSYWGGAAPAIGGALILGALPRLRRSWQTRHAVLFGVGVAILGGSRPFEGTLTVAAASGVLVWWIFQTRGPTLRAAILRVALPIVLVAGCAVAGFLYYFDAVTGNPLRMPYVTQRQTYASAQYFYWQQPTPEPLYHHQAMRDFYIGWELNDFTAAQTFVGAVRNNAMKGIAAWLFFLGPLLTVPLLFLRQVLMGKRLAPLWIIGGLVLGGMSLTVWFYAHYMAPIAGVLFVAIAQGTRHLRVWRRRSGTGLMLARAIPIICLATISLRLVAQPLGAYFPPAWPMTWFHTPEGNMERARVLGQLTALEGEHLAIVRYGPNHRAVMNEWVYNEAAIDKAKVVFAREMDAASNQELIRYFQGRTVWLIEADAEPARVTPYPKL